MPIECDWCGKRYAHRSGFHYHLNRKPAEITIVDTRYRREYTFVTCQDEPLASIRRRLLENRKIEVHAVFQAGTRDILDEETFRKLRLKPGAKVRVLYLRAHRI
ncbi:hypothetical protein AAVH_05766 [Aphelenchoides avenae]|nr:hypothetical protein AAVH_05766 [Aphelenchus avenae]